MKKEKSFKKNKNLKKKNRKYLNQLDQRLADTKPKIVKSKKLEHTKEEELKKQVQDKPQLSKGTMNMTKNIGVKNVFERQRLLLEAKNAQNNDNVITERYKQANGITSKPQINQKSRSLQRTIEDLYPRTSSRAKEKAFTINDGATKSTINQPRQTNSYRRSRVEDRLLAKGQATKKRLSLQRAKTDNEYLQ